MKYICLAIGFLLNKTTRIIDVEDFSRGKTKKVIKIYYPFCFVEQNSDYERNILLLGLKEPVTREKFILVLVLKDRNSDLSICLVQKNFKRVSITGKNFSSFGRELVEIFKFFIAKRLMRHPVCGCTIRRGIRLWCRYCARKNTWRVDFHPTVFLMTKCAMHSKVRGILCFLHAHFDFGWKNMEKVKVNCGRALCFKFSLEAVSSNQ